MEQVVQIDWGQCNQRNRDISVPWSSSSCRSFRRGLAKEWKTVYCLPNSSKHLMGLGNGIMDLTYGRSDKIVNKCFGVILSVRRVSEKFECFLPSASSNRNWAMLRKVEKFDVSCNGQHQHSENVDVSDLKFESLTDVGNDMAVDQIKPTQLTKDSVNFGKVLDTVISQQDTEKDAPWWQEFPKRWVIVVLCFFAFLLCNMDRVLEKVSFGVYHFNSS
eukprot:Gb_01307 [translate_table: standard]